MNELKLCKTTVVRTLLPLAAVLVFFLVLLAAKALSVEGVSEYYELLTGAAAFAAAFFTVKEIFSLSVCCGVSRKKSFAAILICAFVTAFIVVAAHSIESFIFADKLKGTVMRLDGVAVDYTHAEILQNYSLLLLSFSKSIAYIYLMLCLRTVLIFMSGTAFFIIMSRLETMGRIINLGVIVILFAANIAGGMFTPYLAAPVMSYGFFESVFGIFGAQAFTITYILLTILAIAVSFAFYRRNPIKYKRSV